jgi:hypothetical protein
MNNGKLPFRIEQAVTSEIGMKSGQTEAVSEAGIGWLRFAVADRLGWIFREQATQDKGVDAHVEEIANGKPTGRLIGMQIKSGVSWMKEKSEKGFTFRGDFEHLAYWRGHSLPIMVVVFDPQSQEAYWQIVSEGNVRENKKGWSLTVPFENRISADVIPIWSEICSPMSRKDYIRKKRKFSEIASLFQTVSDRRQTLLYEALHQTTHSLFVSTPFIDESTLSVLDFMSVKCPVRLIVGPEQRKAVWRLIESRAGKGLEVRVCPSLHLKQVIFDSLLLMAGSANLTSVSWHYPTELFSLIVEEAASQNALNRFFDLWSGCLDLVFDPLNAALPRS